MTFVSQNAVKSKCTERTLKDISINANNPTLQGGHVMTPLPGCTPTKPGAATFPFFGIEPALLSEDGKEIKGEGEGYLVRELIFAYNEI